MPPAMTFRVILLFRRGVSGEGSATYITYKHGATVGWYEGWLARHLRDAACWGLYLRHDPVSHEDDPEGIALVDGPVPEGAYWMPPGRIIGFRLIPLTE